MLEEIFRYQFLQHAILSAIFASIACGIIGTIITEKNLIMMSGGIAHTAFGGIGMGYFIGIEPIFGALVFSIVAALGVNKIHKKTHTGEDILVGMFWSLGMALGILFIWLTPGYPPELSSYLFGDILTVSKMDLYMMIIVNVMIVGIVGGYFQQFKAYLFDEEFAAVIGMKTSYLEKIVFILIALTIVILIRVVGIILIIALLTVPTAIAKEFSYDLKKIMILSSLVGILFCLFGLFISYLLQIPSGASIVISLVISYLIICIIKNKIKKGKLSI
ncbi:metal ABC transporter permease [Anaerophilus nitritogenes]|uniref:metal ABC transporter permease n=1 Tax=Anaerophilus nitritogenes TaxID=2498136 RepID=UPI00101BD8A8|nr:metal ABC transporter permease [Anaerophilus nitritogenes]